MHNKDGVIAKKIDPMLTTTEVSRQLHVHPNTLRRWSDKGIIKTYRIGSRADRRFKQNDIARFLAQLRVNGGNPHKAKMF
ncbi:helix-turn-helix domain-containing protein [Chloroflexota bacterium]